MATAREELTEILLRQKLQMGPEHLKNPEESKREWLDDLAAFFRLIDEWLAKFDSELLRRNQFLVDMDESQLGKYLAPARQIQTPAGVIISIIPRGRKITNALGRVDLLAPHSRATLLRINPGEWHFLGSSANVSDMQTIPMTEESFIGVLKTLLA